MVINASGLLVEKLCRELPHISLNPMSLNSRFSFLNACWFALLLMSSGVVLAESMAPVVKAIQQVENTLHAHVGISRV